MKVKLAVLSSIVLVLVMAPSWAEAQNRPVRRAVPRASVAPRVVRPPVVAGAPYRYYGPRYYGPRHGYYGYYGYPRPYYGYGPGFSFGFSYGSPGYYGYGPSWYGFGYPVWGYGYGGYPGHVVAVPGVTYGGIRLDLPQRNAEVYADGYLAGMVDNFDGTFQQLNLEPGPHKIEIRSPGFETIAIDVNVQPGRTITYRADMREVQ
jgi:hypothetical protein